LNNDTTSIASIFSQGANSAVFILKEEDKVISPISSWVSSPKDYDIARYALSVADKVDYLIVNNSMHSLSGNSKKRPPLMASILKKAGIRGSIETVEPFDLTIGISALEAHKSAELFSEEGFELWLRLDADIKRSEEKATAEVMAFLQGLIELAYSDYSNRPFHRATIPSISGDEAIEWMSR
jgi:hypothetical protein